MVEGLGIGIGPAGADGGFIGDRAAEADGGYIGYWGGEVPRCSIVVVEGVIICLSIPSPCTPECPLAWK